MSKKKAKDKNIARISKLIIAGETDKVFSELANVVDVGYLFQVGVVCMQNGVHDAGEKIFDKICKLKPDYAKAWFNKGVALGKLGKPDEEIKCFNEAIKLNPNDAEAWLSKGVALGKLGKPDEEIKCFNEAINVNPNLAEAYRNLGVTFLNLHRYDDAETRLGKAEKIFSDKGRKNEANEAKRLKLSAINASKLISRMKPLDQEFMDCLSSQSLTELREKSLKISREKSLFQCVVRCFTISASKSGSIEKCKGNL